MLRYMYSVSSTALNINSICKDRSISEKEIIWDPLLVSWFEDFSSKWERSFPPPFIQRYQQVIYNVSIGKEDTCKQNLRRGVAVVKFQLAAKTVTRIEKRIKFSSADILSSIGKYILFLYAEIFKKA